MHMVGVGAHCPVTSLDPLKIFMNLKVKFPKGSSICPMDCPVIFLEIFIGKFMWVQKNSHIASNSMSRPALYHLECQKLKLNSMINR